MVYTRIFDWRDCTITVDPNTNAVEFEPAKILEQVPKSWTNDTKGLIVNISDGSSEVEYTFEKFLAHSYEIHEGMIKFGQKHLDIGKLKVIIGVKFLLEDIALLYSVDVD